MSSMQLQFNAITRDGAHRGLAYDQDALRQSYIRIRDQVPKREKIGSCRVGDDASVPDEGKDYLFASAQKSFYLFRNRFATDQRQAWLLRSYAATDMLADTSEETLHWLTCFKIIHFASS